MEFLWTNIELSLFSTFWIIVMDVKTSLFLLPYSPYHKPDPLRWHNQQTLRGGGDLNLPLITCYNTSSAYLLDAAWALGGIVPKYSRTPFKILLNPPEYQSMQLNQCLEKNFTCTGFENIWRPHFKNDNCQWQAPEQCYLRPHTTCYFFLLYDDIPNSPYSNNIPYFFCVRFSMINEWYHILWILQGRRKGFFWIN